MSSLFSSPTFNVGGLASGLDTNTIVSQLLAIERRPRVRLEQRVQVEEARQSALNDVQTRLKNLSLTIAGLRDVSTWGDVQTVDSADPTKVGARRVGGAAAGGYSVQVVALARAAQATQGSSSTSATSDDTLHIEVGVTSPTSVDVAITAGDTQQMIADKINGSSGTPVYASVVNGKLILSGKETGADRTIAVTDGNTGNAYDLAADLGYVQTQAPQNADFWVDSNHFTDRTSNVVTNVLPGIELTLKSSTGGSTVGVNVGAPTADSASVVTKVQAFVDQYNSTLDFIRSKLDEAKVASPTTAAERAKGVLRGDPGLTALVSRLRAGISDIVGGRPVALDQLSEVGISTGASTGVLNKDAIAGTITLSATLLTEKLAASFGDVKALFTNVTGDAATEGLAQRFSRHLDPWLTGVGTDAPVLTTRIKASKDTVSSLRERMADVDARLAMRERTLRAQFTRMETALQAAQSQSEWLTGQIAGLQ